MANPFYLFLHIPKTAGTTLRSILDFQYGAQNVLTYYNQNSTQLLDNLDALIRVGSKNYQVLIGHFQYGVHATLTRQSKYVTFLRDPVGRAASSYFENAKVMSPAVINRNGQLMSFDSCFKERPEFFANQQLKMIIGKDALDPVDSSDLELAKDNIERDFIFTGISEHFDTSILLLSRLFHWRPCAYQRLNVRSKKEQLAPQELASLRQVNRFEISLYEDVLNNLFSDVRRAGKTFHSALKELSAANSAAAKTRANHIQALPDDYLEIRTFLDSAHEQ